jgi:hypothetical protein
MIRVLNNSSLRNLSLLNWWRAFQTPGLGAQRYDNAPCRTAKYFDVAPQASAVVHVVELESGAVWSQSCLASTRLICRAGTLWVTCSGDATDYLLRAGQALCVPADNSRVVVQAMDDKAVFECR